MRNHIIEEKPVAGVGAEIFGVDLREPLSEQAYLEVRQALNTYGVIFFRDQMLTPEQHLGFAERFGEINVSKFLVQVPGHPAIAEVRKEPEQTHNVGGGWHTDHSYDQAPALGSILLARELPDRGGDTLFANMSAAFEALSDGLKKTLLGLKAVHSNAHVFGPNRPASRRNIGEQMKNTEHAVQEAIHPVVIRHPESGKRVLYVNQTYTVRFDGWTEQESAPLLNFLFQHATRPEFTCRFRWREGSIAFWDNRATWHFAVNDYHGERRLMHRVTLEGVPLPPAV
jgi:taurine dioxygenase